MSKLKGKIESLAQPVPILGKGGVVPQRFIEVKPYEPTEESIVVDMLNESPLASDGVENLQ
ncbi:hypothetical protein SBDP1_1310003 [Syntrophobacter sp. SbD1]|nr:hypothetical protein SBDP1_1310003 [Syntrophobacter sp. SbD1]